MSSKTFLPKKCEKCKRPFFGIASKKYCGSIKEKMGCAYKINLASSRNSSATRAQEKFYFDEETNPKTKPRMKRNHWRSEACSSGYF